MKYYNLGCIILLTLLVRLSLSIQQECATLQYVELGKRSMVQCSFGSFIAVLWYIEGNEDFIIAMTESRKEGPGYSSGEYDISANGSLIIANVTIIHETVFKVTKITSSIGSAKTYAISVHTVVMSTDTVPVIEPCPAGEDICYADNIIIAERDSINCRVRDSRPPVNLNWFIRTAGSDENITSSIEISEEDGHTFTSISYTTYPLFQSSLLSLLVCMAVGSPRVLRNDESLILVDKTNIELLRSDVKAVVTYVERDSVLNLKCTDNVFDLLIWKRLDEYEIIGFKLNFLNNLTKTYTNQFHIGNDSSLSVQKTKVRHEGLYLCAFNNLHKEQVKEYEVHLYVQPFPTYLSVDGCNHGHHCVLEVEQEGKLTCRVSGIRPAVQLEWRSYSSDILFTQHYLVVEEEGETINIALTATLTVSPTSDRLFVVECQIVGPHAELFNLSRIVQLFDPTVYHTIKTTEIPSVTMDLLPWIVVCLVILLLLFINLAIVTTLVITRYKGRRKKAKEARAYINDECTEMIIHHNGTGLRNGHPISSSKYALKVQT